MKSVIGCYSFVLFVALALLSPLQAEAVPLELRNARVYIDGELRDAHIRIENERITAIGDFTTAPGARVIDLKKRVVYPGFIDPWTYLGFADAKPAEENRQRRESTPIDLDAGPPVRTPSARRKGLRPSYECAHNYLFDKLSLEYRRGGFTLVQTMPRWGYLAGHPALVQPIRDSRRSTVLRRQKDIYGSFFSGGGRGYPGTTMGLMAHLRQFFLDVLRYQQLKARFDSGEAVPFQYDPALEAASTVMGKSASARLIWNVDGEEEILRALTLKREFSLNLVLTGLRESDRILDKIKAANVPVIISLDVPRKPKAPKSKDKKKPGKEKPGSDKPGSDKSRKKLVGPFEQIKNGSSNSGSDKTQDKTSEPDWNDASAVLKYLDAEKREFALKMKAWNKKVDLVLKLQSLGLAYSFSANNLKNPRDLLRNLEEFTGRGLKSAAIVEGLVTGPAKLLGIEATHGEIKVGKFANFTILEKPLGAKSNDVGAVVIDGHCFDYKLQEKPKKKSGKKGSKKAAARADFAGLWIIKLPGNPMKARLEIEQHGDSITGQLDTPYGIAKVTGEVSGNSLTFVAKAKLGGQRVKIDGQAKLKNGELHGTISSPLGRNQGFTAERVPEWQIQDFLEPRPFHGNGCDCYLDNAWERSKR